MHSMYLDSDENRILCADTEFINSRYPIIDTHELNLVDYSKNPIVTKHNEWKGLQFMVCSNCKEKFIFETLIELQSYVKYLKERN